MAAKYAPIQSFESKQLSVNLLDDPDNFYMHNRRYATSVILTFVYGRRAPICMFPHFNWLIQGTVMRSVKSMKCSAGSSPTVVQVHFSSTPFPLWQISLCSTCFQIGRKLEQIYTKPILKSF